MILNNSKKYVLLIPLILVTFMAQMPDWILMKDREGNRYYMDRQGKIYIPDEPSPFLRTLNSKNIEFFVNKGIALWYGNHRERGLSLLKSALCLRVTSQRVYQMQKKASDFINQVKQREGGRYDAVDKQAHLLLYQDENERTRLVNEVTGYRLSVDGVVYLLRKKFRSDHRGYLYTGIRMGCVFKSETTDAGKKPGSYDVLIGLESEKFPSKLRSAREFEQHWKRITGDDTFKRTVISKKENTIIYSFSDEKGEFSGMECYLVNGNRGCFMRSILPASQFQARKSVLLSIARSLSM